MSSLRSGPVTPLFIFCLPRSGSTLLQRVLAAHPEIATASEPWILLPQLYAFRGHGVRAEYAHGTMAAALRDFRDHLPQGQDDYRRELRRFVLNLYTLASESGARYFLDKT